MSNDELDISSADLPDFKELVALAGRAASEAGVHTSRVQRRQMANTLLRQHAARNSLYAKEKTSYADPVPNEVMWRLRKMLAAQQRTAATP